MTVWYVHRQGGTISAAFTYEQPGYADEALDDASNAEIITYRASVTAVSPSQPNPYDWLNRLSAAKQSAIWTSATANPVILGWLFKAVARTTINLADPVTVGGISFFVAAGILSADDQTLLLTP